MALVSVVVPSGVFVLIGVLLWRARPNEEPVIGSNAPPEFMIGGRSMHDPVDDIDKPWREEPWVADQLRTAERHDAAAHRHDRHKDHARHRDEDEPIG